MESKKQEVRKATRSKLDKMKNTDISNVISDSTFLTGTDPDSDLFEMDPRNSMRI
jgi:hypothetical protein